MCFRPIKSHHGRGNYSKDIKQKTVNECHESGKYLMSLRITAFLKKCKIKIIRDKLLFVQSVETAKKIKCKLKGDLGK